MDSVPLLCPVEPCYSAVAQRSTIQKYQQKDASIRGLKTRPHRNVRGHFPEPAEGTGAAATLLRAEAGTALNVPLLLPFPFQKSEEKKSQSHMPVKKVQHV